MTTICFIHSKIQESIFFNSISNFKDYFVIYGRGYVGRATNSIFFESGHIRTQYSLLSWAIRFNELLESLNAEKVQLIVPHFFHPLFRLLASHNKVNELLYLEEGDLNYSETKSVFHIEDFSMCELEIFKIIKEDLKKLSFNVDNFNIFSSNNFFFTNAHGKFKGVITCSDETFKDFPGIRIQNKINDFYEFPSNSKFGLILISDPNFFIDLLKLNLIKNNFRPRTLEYLKRQVIELFEMIFKSICESSINSGVNKIFYKKHPTCPTTDCDRVINSFSQKEIIENWENSHFSVLAQNYEFGFMNFSCFYSIGSTSASRYATNCGLINKSKINVYGHSEIIFTILSRIKDDTEVIENIYEYS